MEEQGGDLRQNLTWDELKVLHDWRTEYENRKINESDEKVSDLRKTAC